MDIDERDRTNVNGERPEPAVVRPFSAPPQPTGWPRSAVVTAIALASLVAVALVGAGFLLGAGVFDGSTDDGAAATDPAAGAADPDTVAPGPVEGKADGEAEAAADSATPGQPANGANATGQGPEGADPTASVPTAATAGAATAGATTSGAATSGEVAGEATPASTGAAASGAASARTAVYDDGTVYLRGRVPSQEVADELVSKVATVVGVGNVVNEYRIDPAAPLTSATPLYVDDTVLFDYGSAEIRSEFVPLLELGVTLLQGFPKSSMTVIGHTDAAGSAEFNLRLSQRRAQAVVDYLRGRGIAAERVEGEARGEADPVADNATERGSAANRRAEFVVHDLLAG